MSKPCESCKLRAIYERSPKSIGGRLWRWHIKFCPGWRSYYRSLDDQERKRIAESYNISKR